ncbi:MAG TPA: bifunctional riboflavin kinase/FAD synthetase [Sedimentisphaerales bacterium]|nr:bifunctional riboflavin kinase/FAD synthetase [Sedimentisphaerales bacterium]
MRIIEKPSDLQTAEKGGVLTIGNFDGVHLGHQEILSAAKRAARKRQTPLLAMTFDPHPVAVLKPDKRPGVLTPLSLKSHYLSQAGVDWLIVLKSTPELLSLSADDFVDRFLVRAIAPAVVIEGRDFNFGRARTGNIDKLQYLGAEKGFEVCIVEPKNIELSTGQTVRVSSTVIRDLLEAGAVADAALALGRPYRLIGRVIPGHGKGKQLGFPTANLERSEQIIPAHGVYAGRVEIGDTADEVCETRNRIAAALSIGHAPTVASNRPQLIEAHLLIENVPDLTGKFLAMDFIQHLRPQQKFDSEEHLTAQIANDCNTARNILAELG